MKKLQYGDQNVYWETEKDEMVERYLKKTYKDRIKSEDAYLDFLEKIILMEEYSYLPKWLKEYKEFTNSCRKRIN
jgi:hypothetical protein